MPDRDTNVPPVTGPLHGATPLTTLHTDSYCRPSDVKSAPFEVTSTDTYPAHDATLAHTSESPPASSSARTTVPFRRHCRYPSDSDADVKPEPCTVSGVPPSAEPCTGHTDDTATAPVYVYATPSDVNCWPFRLTSMLFADAPDDTGDAHST